jgi:hypothetical protein
MDAVVTQVTAANSRLSDEGVVERFSIQTEPFIERRGSGSFEFLHITLVRPAVTFDGWSVVAVRDVDDANPDSSIRALPACTQCAPPVEHTRIFTLSHQDRAATQVGASCLKAFLGEAPSGLWTVGANVGLDDIQRAVGHRASLDTRVYSPEDVLIATLAATDDGRKYISVFDADGAVHPTVHVVRESWDRLLRSEHTPARRELANKIIRWAREIDSDPGPYLSDVKSLFSTSESSPWIRSPQIGLAISAVKAYMTAQKRAAPRTGGVPNRSQPAPNPYLGSPGEKIRDVSATVQLITHKTRVIRGADQDSSWIVLVSGSGHSLTWSSSSHQNFTAGDRVVISSATVKANRTFNGTSQTNLARAKIVHSN